jgi:hypothetical protein
MATLNLINSLGKRGVSYGLYSLPADVDDTDFHSQYFVVSEFNTAFTAGKNAFSINGSPHLLNQSEIYIECIDSNGNNLYIELAENSNANGIINNTYKAASSGRLFSIYVFDDTSDGVGWIILYGTLSNGKTVKWMQNITINRALSNESTVRFYQVPTFNVESSISPVINFSIGSQLVSLVKFTGKGNGLAINPPKDTSLATINKVTTDIDYRFTFTTPIVNDFTPDNAGFTSQMIGSTLVLYVHSIQPPASKDIISISQTSSFTIKDIINNNTLIVSDPFTYKDDNGNDIVTNVIGADFNIEYPYISYNNSAEQYQTASIGNFTYTLQASYADITYTNLRTFTGYVARHKLYAKSIVKNSDYSLVSDSPITPNELLIDQNTLNTYYNNLGKFYNDQHIANYWHTSSNNLTMSHTPTYAIDSTFVTTPNLSSLTGSDYIIVKNNSDPGNSNNATYFPYNETQQIIQSGSSYDSNFIELNSNTQYKIILSAVIHKKYSDNAKLDLYFTSSLPGAPLEKNYTKNFGIKLMELNTNTSGSIIDFTDSYTFYTPQHDLFGTLVIVPSKCNIHIKNISLSVFGDDGYSPDTFSLRIPWPVSIANETYQIKAELFDVNSNLVYSDLNIVQSFDPSGQSLTPNVNGGITDTLVVNNLYVSQSIVIANGDLEIPNIPPRLGLIPYLYQSRIISIGPDGGLVFTPITDVSCDDEHIQVTLGDAYNVYDPTPTAIKQSLTAQYDGISSGRKIYFDQFGTKIIETGP